MRLISEEQSSALITHELAYTAVREAFVAVTRLEARIFPAVIAQVSPDGRRMSVKSGADHSVVGLKVGSYWPGNEILGLPRHSSTVFLVDARTGRVEWAIEASLVNAYRTAAADAVAVDALARSDAATLAIFGAGHQAWYECLAVARVRPITRVLVVPRDPAKTEAFAARLRAEGLAAEAADARAACEAADIIVTATPSREPLFDADWVAPGTHVSAMGTDAAGKQELPPALFARAALFCDLPEQSLVIGELQHAPKDGVIPTAIGAVLCGQATGRSAADQITIFDSSGIAFSGPVRRPSPDRCSPAS